MTNMLVLFGFAAVVAAFGFVILAIGYLVKQEKR